MSGRLFSFMETTLSFHSLRRVLHYTTNLTQSNHTRTRDINQFSARIENQKTTAMILMEDQAPEQKLEAKEKEIVGGEKSSSSATIPPPPPPPPPPEKLLPGECCSSGCVRCVWDVYHEELKEYDKLYKSDDSGSKPKP